MTLHSNIIGLIQSLKDANANFQAELDIGFTISMSREDRPAIVRRNIQHNKEIIELLEDCISSADDTFENIGETF